MVIIGLATDEIKLEEYSIWEEMERRGLEYELINLNSFLFKPLDEMRKTLKALDVGVIINRATSSSIREISSEIFEAAGAKVLNSYGLEQIANSKIRTKIVFENYGVPSIDYMLIPTFPISKLEADKGYIFKKPIAEGIEAVVLNAFGKAVGKPPGGSRGNSITTIMKRGDLLERCKEVYEEYEGTGLLTNYTLYQNLRNQYGLYVERFVPHALDLRVPVIRDKIFNPLVRAVPSDDIVPKNTALGALSTCIELPHECRRLTKKIMSAVIGHAKRRGYEVEGYICGVDIIPMCEDAKERQVVYDAVREVAPLWKIYVFPAKDRVNRVLRKYGQYVREALGSYPIKLSMKEVLQMFRKELRELLPAMDEGYQKVRSSSEHLNLQDVAVEHLENCTLLANEINLSPDFRYNTHNLATAEIPAGYVDVALSMIN